MIVGQHSLYNSFLNPNKKDTTAGRGRSVLLINNRNTLLCFRYYYYAFLKKYTYPNALKQLEIELYISETTIIKCLSEKQPLLKTIFDEKPQINELKKQYDWLVWN